MLAAVRMAVVGHVEWATFARVPRTPATGEIVHATLAWEAAAGGGSVAAARLVELGAETHFFTAIGDDEAGARALGDLASLGVHVHAARRSEPQRRAFVHVDDAGERTITTTGRRLEPHREDALPWATLGACDAVYVTAGDMGAVRAARAARVLVSTPRILSTLAATGVAIDALVASAEDVGERYTAGQITPEPALVVRTEGARGGAFVHRDGRTGRWPAAALPGPMADTYGAGDSFAAALTFGLGEGLALDAALALASKVGARALTERAPYARKPVP